MDHNGWDVRFVPKADIPTLYASRPRYKVFLAAIRGFAESAANMPSAGQH
jgi:hypothetical protein